MGQNPLNFSDNLRLGDKGFADSWSNKLGGLENIVFDIRGKSRLAFDAKGISIFDDSNHVEPIILVRSGQRESLGRKGFLLVKESFAGRLLAFVDGHGWQRLIFMRDQDVGLLIRQWVLQDDKGRQIAHFVGWGFTKIFDYEGPARLQTLPRVENIGDRNRDISAKLALRGSVHNPDRDNKGAELKQASGERANSYPIGEVFVRRLLIMLAVCLGGALAIFRGLDSFVENRRLRGAALCVPGTLVGWAGIWLFWMTADPRSWGWWL